VGVIAAPFVGPPLVALLALVGARGDPWFGFKSFFTLAMGLGAPYLVLGTFSNLLQRLPRSGDWMVWVKKVFGVITKYASPEAERWRRQYGINGVPTVVFLTPDRGEVLPARVEGFLAPAPFLERVRIAGAAGERAPR